MQITPKNRSRLIAGVVAVVASIVLFNGILFYNEAGYQTHVRTIFGEEKVVTDVGYATKWFGRATAWKQAQSIQFVGAGKEGDDGYEGDGNSVEGFRIVFLGNVDAGVEASTRFRLPTGDQFLSIAQEYRTPENFANMALIPAVKETLQSTASLMTADDYFAGARSEFGAEFESQLNYGQYTTRRVEQKTRNSRNRNEGVNLTSGAGQEGEMSQTEFVTIKEKGANGEFLRKQQQFRLMGVSVVEARITNIDPNNRYRERMVKVQNALADLAVARQDRLKEEEQKLLATARGEKLVEEKRQETLRDQIEQTTNAETKKQLVLIEAEREKQRAIIERQTAGELLEKARIDALATKTTADADAYAKEVVLKADGALDKKLAALTEIHAVWANAASKAPVPSVMMGGNGDGATSRQSELGTMLNLLSAKAARDLSLDISVRK